MRAASRKYGGRDAPAGHLLSICAPYFCSVDRRDFLKTVAVVGVAGAGLLASPAEAAAAATAMDRRMPTDATYPVRPELIPFGHGVRSGDPLPDRVVLWTRITIPDRRGFDAAVVTDPQGIRSVPVGWVIARDIALTDVVRRGSVITAASRDWTVKVDADHLPAATTLYYAFTALGYRSPIGRTRTAPALDAVVPELTIAHLSCSSWWQDVFNAQARIGERNDLDLITHSGDYIYDSCGGHPASRYWKGQQRWDVDLDNRGLDTVSEVRRRYALYAQDAHLIRAHLAAPFAIMIDNHDGDTTGKHLTAHQLQSVFWEWTPSRPPLPDGSGRFGPSTGPDINMPIPQGKSAGLLYRSLSYGKAAEILLIDVRRFINRPGEKSQVLGDVQWAWMQRVILDSKRRGVTFRYINNGVNLGQLRAFNVPAAQQFRDAFGIDTAAPQGEIYATAWGAHPPERTRLLSWLRKVGVVDNVVLSGDSHGFFGYDLVEDPELPNYEPATGGGLLGAVGVEMVPSTQGRPGGQDVLAEAAYFAANNGSRGAAFNDAANYDLIYRTAALQPTLDLETAAKAANPNLQYFNWRAEYGYTMVHLRKDRAVLENFTTPQRVLSPDQVLLAQFSSPVGKPHLGRVLMPHAIKGSRQDAAAPAAVTEPVLNPSSRQAGLPTNSHRMPEANHPATVRPSAPEGNLPVTGGATGVAVAGAAAVLAAGVLRRRL